MNAKTQVKEHPGAFQRREFLQLLGTSALGLALSDYTSFAGDKPAPRGKSGAKPLRGVFPIGQTPFTEADKLDLDGLAAEVKFCNRGRVHGFIWPQIASGWTVLSEQERLDGAEAILAAGKGRRTALVIGVQSQDNDMAAVGRYAKHAAKNGADAIVSLPPANVTDEKVLLDYYQQVGRLTELPLFVQSQGSMSIDLIVELFNTIPTFRQVKDEAGDPLQRIAEIRRRTNDQLKVFSGNGVRTMVTEMELGFSGHCPTTALADVYAAAFDLWHAGIHAKAFDMFGRILAFNTIVGGGGNNILIARGVFKPTTKSRNAPAAAGVDEPAGTGGGGGRGGRGGGRGGGGGGGRGARQLDAKEIRAALDAYLKPYLKS